MFAVIGGSGLDRIELENAQAVQIQTPYGSPSSEIVVGEFNGVQVAFLSRHGTTIKVPPHMVNYRANMWALKSLKPRAIVALASVGSVREQDIPGTIACPDQIIDYSWGRQSSYNEGKSSSVTHIDFTYPFDKTIRQALLEAAQRLGQHCIDGGVYACTQGPRLETAAEVVRIGRDGGHYIGMTLMPEAALARELEIPYAALNQIVNHAAGVASAKEGIAFGELVRVLQQSSQISLAITMEAFVQLKLLAG